VNRPNPPDLYDAGPLKRGGNPPGSGSLGAAFEICVERPRRALDLIPRLDRHPPAAVETPNRNSSRYFLRLPEVRSLDITALDPSEVMDEAGVHAGEVDLLVGGPPCVAFSKSGFHLEYKREGRDPRAGLLGDYLRFLEALAPRAYLMENVYGLAYNNQSAPFFKALRSGIENLGYSFGFEVLNAADYGVPQNRQRLFVLGARGGRELEFPSSTHWGEHERRSVRSACSSWPTRRRRCARCGVFSVPGDAW
jgi:DNA (cytosine-5)-methyltransferase 1